VGVIAERASLAAAIAVGSILNQRAETLKNKGNRFAVYCQGQRINATVTEI
jgi:hypothetical protein